MLPSWKISLLLASLLVACASPAPADPSLSLVSDQGLVEADVQVVTPVQLGDNQLFVSLRPRAGGGEASLVAVNASMAAHGHEAHAAALERTAIGYHVRELDLFMSGRWQVEPQLELDEQRDTARLPVDVP